ncbi:MAG: undecaprenyl-diphosphate phosphatase [Candidatus Diapherotrites archaeon]|nr:undecaprenyl-diphosphate phosphatase [Candidatus Diapherotrites archaeon]
MDLWQAVVLGALQGIFEWLPVSSQGQIMGFAVTVFKLGTESALKYAVMLHAGTMLAATLYFRKALAELLKLENRQLLRFLLIALIATGITAIPCYLLLRMVLTYNSFFLLFIIGMLLIFTGISQKKRAAAESIGNAKLTKINALFLGLAQGLSVLPGISRSGITTSTLLFEGFKPEQAFRISFILSIPSVFFAEILYGALEGFVLDFNALIALLVAFTLGLLLIDVLLKIAKRTSFSKFCIAFGILYILVAVMESSLISQ